VKKLSLLLLLTLISISDFWVISFTAHADVEWEIKKQLRLKAKPLDLAASLDGKYIYLLFEGRLLIYSLVEDKGKNAIPVDKSFDMLTLSERNKLLILTSSSEQIVRMIELEFIQKLDYGGLPYKGPENAAVTITAFIDYQ
jgi:hypothetical protein